ncbi:MAG: hypothetical protein M3Q69_00620 [Acidobacteriota bacterium]|nr:hypothetical protein [Acidobacteriota bacterium]
MAIVHKQRGSSTVAGGTAQYVLERLIAAAHVTRAEVAQYVSELPAEIKAIEERLAWLRSDNGEQTPDRAAERAGASRRRTRTPKPAKALAGAYGGLIRRVPAAEKAQYESIKRTRGIEAAIAALQARKKPSPTT